MLRQEGEFPLEQWKEVGKEPSRHSGSRSSGADGAMLVLSRTSFALRSERWVGGAVETKETRLRGDECPHPP